MKVTNILLLIVILVVVVLLIGRFDFSEGDFNMYNPAWNGMTQFSGNHSIGQIGAISDLSAAGENTTLLIVGPTKNFTAGESAQVGAFMQRGGLVVVMDDFGTANSLLFSLNSSVTLNQLPLCDDNSYYKQYSFPIITDIVQTDLTSNVNELVLNHPSTLKVKGNATILASTSNLGWIDKNANLWIDGEESYGKYPVIASAHFGKGKLVVISDPDVIVNVMLDKGNNSVFASDILKSGVVYVDMSHGQKVPPMATAFYIIKYDQVAQVLCSLLVFLAGLAVYRRKTLRSTILDDRETNPEVDRKRAIIDFMKAKLPVKENDIKELDKKL